MKKLEDRKKIERFFHNRICDTKTIGSNERFYSITLKSEAFVKQWLKKDYSNKMVLDYCCGYGKIAVYMAKNKARVTGIDLSQKSIQNAKLNAKRENVEVEFLVKDAENTFFKNSSFDLIFESGSLHHLDLEKAYIELARILRPEGKILCVEVLKYNPLIHMYRKLTPKLRTEWEVKHIFGRNEINLAKKYFKNIEILGFFHLVDLLAVPFRDSVFFRQMLKLTGALDSILLEIPIIKWNAWQIVFLLSEPNKEEK